MSSSDQENVERAMYEPRRIPTWLVLPVMLALVLIGVLAGRMTQNVQQPTQIPGWNNVNGQSWTPTPRPTGDTVSLAIEYGNGASKRFKALSWQRGMTVHELLIAATEFRPPISAAVKGTGEMAFVTSIDGLENAGADGGNWIYQVNGEKATVGMGARKLEPGDDVLWKFEPAP